MRIIIPALAVAGLAVALGGCASQKTYETALNVCSSGNGTVKTATVTKSSGDPAVDAKAVEIGKAMVYEPTPNLSCKPLVVEHNLTGENA